MDRSLSPTRCVEMATRSLQLPSSCPSPDAFKATSRTRKCRLFAAFDHVPGALVGCCRVSAGTSVARRSSCGACTSEFIRPPPQLACSRRAKKDAAERVAACPRPPERSHSSHVPPPPPGGGATFPSSEPPGGPPGREQDGGGDGRRLGPQDGGAEVEAGEGGERLHLAGPQAALRAHHDQQLAAGRRGQFGGRPATPL